MAQEECWTKWITPITYYICIHICKTPEVNNKNNLEKQDVEKIPSTKHTAYIGSQPGHT